MLLYWISLGGGFLGVIFFHELGHFLAARWCGLGVSSFSMGIGPELIGFTDRSGMRWRLAALPLGGSVGIRNERNTVDTSVEKREAEGSVSFCEASIKHRAVVCLAGPLFSIILAIGIVAGVCGSYGVDAIIHLETAPFPAVIAFLVSGMSIFFAGFNLLPVPPLDGGRFVFILIEAWRARPVSERLETTVSRAGFVIVSAVSLITTAFAIAGMR
jgi:regulator of sigma E protease